MGSLEGDGVGFPALIVGAEVGRPGTSGVTLYDISVTGNLKPLSIAEGIIF